jgi:hypothetical protein
VSAPERGAVTWHRSCPFGGPADPRVPCLCDPVSRRVCLLRMTLRTVSPATVWSPSKKIAVLRWFRPITVRRVQSNRHDVGSQGAVRGCSMDEGGAAPVSAS